MSGIWDQEARSRAVAAWFQFDTFQISHGKKRTEKTEKHLRDSNCQLSCFFGKVLRDKNCHEWHEFHE